MPPKNADPAGAKDRATVKHSSLRRKSKQQNLLNFGFGRTPPPLLQEPESSNRPEKRRRVTPEVVEVEETQFSTESPEPSPPPPAAQPNSDSDEEDDPQLTPYFLDAKPRVILSSATPRRPDVIEIPDSSSPRTSQIRRVGPPASSRSLSPSPRRRRPREPEKPAFMDLNTDGLASASEGWDLPQPPSVIHPSTIPSSQWWENEDTQGNISTQASLPRKPQFQAVPRESSLQHEEAQGTSRCDTQNSPIVNLSVHVASQNSHGIHVISASTILADLNDNPLAQQASQSAASPIHADSKHAEDDEQGHSSPSRDEEMQNEGENTAERSQDPHYQFRPVKTQQLPNSFMRPRTSESLLSEDARSLHSPIDGVAADQISDSKPAWKDGLDEDLFPTDGSQIQALDFGVPSLHEGAREEEMFHKGVIVGEGNERPPSCHIPVPITESQLLPNTLMESFPLPPPMTQYTQPQSSYPDSEETQ